MPRQPLRITHDDAETLEVRCIDSLPPVLQTLADAHHLGQWGAGPSLVERQAAGFITFRNAPGIKSERK